MRKTMRVQWSVWIAAVLLAGCASGVKLDDAAPVETRVPTSVSGAASGAGSSGTAQSQVTSVDLTKPGGAGAGANNTLPRVIYFDFDSYVVRDEYRVTIDGYAKSLSSDRKKRLTVEGHTDERGGREYNLALGQKRAEAVQKALVLLGASDVQIEAVSFGKERPAVDGNDEAAMAKNRRAELNLR